jgi:hypothetical protein
LCAFLISIGNEDACDKYKTGHVSLCLCSGCAEAPNEYEKDDFLVDKVEEEEKGGEEEEAGDDEDRKGRKGRKR